MSLIKDKRRIEKFDYLVQHRMTGTPNELACKLGFSIRQLYNFLNQLKEMNVPVKYSKTRQSYYYTKEGSLQFNFTDKAALSEKELKNIRGGIKRNNPFYQTAISFHY